MTPWLYRIALFVLVVAAVAGGVLLTIRASAVGPTVEVLLPTPTPTPVYKLFVSGEVKNPGVYSFLPGARAEDALAAAGGPTQHADLSRINLAQRLHDQDHIRVPRLGEAISSPTPAKGKVNLNTATEAELRAIPRIGPELARRIISYREEKGSFSRIDQLMAVPGIGPGIYEAVRELVSVE